MELFLMQHGLAEAAEMNPQRPVTAAGGAEVVAVAKLAATCGVGLDEIWHSGKLRAQQTAALLAATLTGDTNPGNTSAGNPGAPQVASRGGLEPDSNPAPIAGWVRGIAAPRRVAIVGHLPFLSRLAAQLTGGDPETGPVAFCNAGLVKLVRGNAGRFQIAWIITPELAEAIAGRGLSEGESGQSR